MSEPRPARRLAVEAAVIVASILVAFAIDAWWDGLQERDARDSVLRALRSDAVAMRVEIERVRSGLIEGSAGVRRFLELGDAPTLAPGDAERVDSILLAIQNAPTFDVPLGATQALLAGGDLSYIASDELVASVTRLLSHVADLEREQQKSTGGIQRFQARLGELGVDLSRVMALAPGEYPIEWRPTDGWRHVGDVELRSILAFVWFYNRNIRTVLDRIEGELNLLDAEVGRRLGVADA